MDPAQLLPWKNELELQIDKLKSQARELDAEIQRKAHQLELVEKLIASHNPNHNVAAVVLPDGNNKDAANGSVAPRPPSVSPMQVKDHVYEILSDANRPMNINEIYAEFIRRGYAIPGKGTPFNILVHISREAKKGKIGRFVWSGRGTYAIRDTASKKKPAKKSDAV